MGLLSGSFQGFERPTLRDRTRDSWRFPRYWSLTIALPWLLGATVFIWQWFVYSRAAERQATTFGVVTEVAKGNRVYYRFGVRDHVYTNMEIPLYSRRVPLLGERVMIYYDSEKPTVNGITDLRQRSIDVLGPVPVLLFLSGVVIFAVRGIQGANASPDNC